MLREAESEKDRNELALVSKITKTFSGKERDINEQLAPKMAQPCNLDRAIFAHLLALYL